MADPIPKSFNPNKHLKEEFVSNLTGSSMLEISVVLSTIPIMVLLRHSISSYSGTESAATNASFKKNDDAVVGSRNWRAYIATLTLDFLFIFLPTILFFTVLAEWAYIGAISLSTLLIVTIAAKRNCASAHLDGGPHTLRASISSYRVIVMITTCVSILAVDFRIFPRKYAKTESYGTGLMDLGVGSFIMSNALVSRQARNVLSMNWKNTFKSVCPLIFLGFGRLLSTRSVDYQVHVGEYGVHWNFFFTLAAVSILTSIINVPPQYSGIVGALILIGYQCWLVNGLNVYLLSNERGMDIISQNKEGIFSIFGYWGMYLVSVQLGNYLFFGNQKPTTLKSIKWARNRVAILSLLFWSVTVILDKYVERVSRRTCNLAYITWILGQHLQELAILMLSEYIPGSKTSALEDSLNRNMLATFLLANVLTGVVNLSTDTLSASSITALLILIAYGYVVSIAIGLADFCGVRVSDKLDHGPRSTTLPLHQSSSPDKATVPTTKPLSDYGYMYWRGPP